MTTSVAAWELGDLERLEQERPELGKIEVFEGALYASGESVNTHRHQRVVDRMVRLLSEAVPRELLAVSDTWWFLQSRKVRPDVGVWRRTDLPSDGGVFRRPPVAVVEVLSEDRDHDLVRKHALYRAQEVPALFLDPSRSEGWWLRVAGHDVDEASYEWHLGAWSVRLIRDQLLEGLSG